MCGDSARISDRRISSQSIEPHYAGRSFVLRSHCGFAVHCSGLTNVQSLTIGGTGLLIVVSVVIEIMKQIESQLIMRDYEGF